VCLGNGKYWQYFKDAKLSIFLLGSFPWKSTKKFYLPNSIAKHIKSTTIYAVLLIPILYSITSKPSVNSVLCFLKEHCPEMFNHRYFHQTIPPGPLIHGLKPFRIWLRIRRDNQHYSSFSGVNDTAETVSAVSMTPLKPPWSWNLKYHRDYNHKNFVFSGPMTQLWGSGLKFQWCQWHRWNLYDTAVTEKRLCESLASFKENIQQNYFMGKYPHTR
jgi:hypothetical protein